MHKLPMLRLTYIFILHKVEKYKKNSLEVSVPRVIISVTSLRDAQEFHHRLVTTITTNIETSSPSRLRLLLFLSHNKHAGSVCMAMKVP